MTTLRTNILLALATAAPCIAQQRFDSAEGAANAVIEATANHDTARLNAIFGPLGSAILTSGNPGEDKAEQSEFSKLAAAKHQLEPDARNPNRMILSIGDEDWPFPVPLVRTGGKWAFDPSEAKVEMQARRIGTHELDAIEICAGYVEAQRKYASADRDNDGLLEYASHVMGGPTALYQEGAAEPLVPRGFAEAVWTAGHRSTTPYHGYFFRVLDAQGPGARGGAHRYVAKNKMIGGFGLVAWPAQYGVTGIHTFIVNQNGIVYQKDIAPGPNGIMPAITRFDPDASWTPVDEPAPDAAISQR
jgi:hypothetical protein